MSMQGVCVVIRKSCKCMCRVSEWNRCKNGWNIFKSYVVAIFDEAACLSRMLGLVSTRWVQCKLIRVHVNWGPEERKSRWRRWNTMLSFATPSAAAFELSTHNVHWLRGWHNKCYDVSVLDCICYGRSQIQTHRWKEILPRAIIA